MKQIMNAGFRTALAVAIAAAALVGCSDDDNDSAGGGGTVNTSGGNGGSGAGGTGGDADYFQIDKYTGAGDVVVKGSGAANASFVVRTATAELGDVSLVVSSSTNLATSMLASCAAAAPATAGTPYMVTGVTSLYKSDGDATACEGAEEVTGVRVNAGATLTLGLNTGGTSAELQFANDVDNRGVITSADASATDRGDIWLYPSSYIGSGQIKTAGTATVPNGGDIYVEADYAILNSGTLNSSGGDTTSGNGGDAGYIDLQSPYYTQNTGRLVADSGDAAAGAGGSGDYIQLYTYNGGVMNSGAVTGKGGNGTTGGGDGAQVYFYNDYSNTTAGDIYNRGAITVSGGNATTSGDGGSAGYVWYGGYGSEVRNSGAITAAGGNGAGATGNGGDGNYFYIDAYAGCGIYEQHPAGNVTVSGSLNLKGGNAVATSTGDGGDGGYVYVGAYNYDYWGNCTTYAASNTSVSFLGYSTLYMNGGDGDQGGSGGDLYAYNQETTVYEGSIGSDYYVPGGNIVLDVNYQGRGGDALANGASANGAGGDGASGVAVETTYASEGAANSVDGSAVTITGTWDISGGQNRDSLSNSNGYGGYAWVWGYDGVAFNGNIKADGGDDVGTDGGTDGYGGEAYEFYLYAETGPVTAGSISAIGGDGEYSAGGGGYINLLGNSVKVSAVHSDGGDADPALAGSTGGDGDWIDLESLNGVSIGSASFTAGDGETAGVEGRLWANNCQGTGC